MNDTELELADTTADPVPQEGRSKKKLLLAAAGAAALLLAGAGVGAWHFWLSPAESGASSEQREDAAYVEVPELLINLRSADGRTRFLKVRLVLETAPEMAESIGPRMPAVVDAMQMFLRELRPEDLAGSSALFRLKEELLVRANRSVGAGQVSDVLIQELVQQ